MGIAGDGNSAGNGAALFETSLSMGASDMKNWAINWVKLLRSKIDRIYCNIFPRSEAIYSSININLK